MDKLKMHSINKVDDNIEKIAGLFPNCVTEAKVDNKLTKVVDFDRLKQELSNFVVEGNEERYQFTWPDKKKSILLANAPIAKTLRPYMDESVDFDNTENLYIEGDNLDVLKLLQETYLGKVKMIYIDPPYNTGNDFVYKDNFAQNTEEYLENSGQFDEEGYQMVPNTESNGRFHTDWLNIMYPRLKLAKDLLADDGVIFISIDDNEVENLKKICNEVFGEDNFLAAIANINNPKGRSDDKYIAPAHEYLLIYAKVEAKIYGWLPEENVLRRYNKVDNKGMRYREIDLRKTGDNDRQEDRPNLFYYFYYNCETADLCASYENKEMLGYQKIQPIRKDGSLGNWRWQMSTAMKNREVLIPKYSSSGNKWMLYVKDILTDELRIKPTTAWTFKDVNSERGTEQFISLGFDKTVFPKPKPLGTIDRSLRIATKNSDLILDFFSGSATTAHAVMQLNAEDGGNRKFIMVQLPETTDEKSEAYKAGYKNICEIGKERIRRAGAKIKEEATLLGQNLDAGFRVLKLESTNMKDVYYNPAELNVSMFDELADNIKKDRNSQDLLFQVMLDLGVFLSSKIEEITINGKKVFNVAEDFLIACFDKDLTDETIEAIARKKPYYFVMRDSSMADDSVATNFEQIFATYSPDTVRKVL